MQDDGNLSDPTEKEQEESMKAALEASWTPCGATEKAERERKPLSWYSRTDYFGSWLDRFADARTPSRRCMARFSETLVELLRATEDLRWRLDMFSDSLKEESMFFATRVIAERTRVVSRARLSRRRRERERRSGVRRERRRELLAWSVWLGPPSVRYDGKRE